MMKRSIIAILCMVFLSLTACGNKSTSSTTESQPVSDTTQNIKGAESPDNNTSENRTKTGEEISEGNGEGTEQGTAEKATEEMLITITAGNQIVVFYGSNSWAYTRLGHVEMGEDELKELLGNEDVTITITEE